MIIQCFNNWKYKGRWNGKLTNLITFSKNVDYSNSIHLIVGLFGLCLFIHITPEDNYGIQPSN